MPQQWFRLFNEARTDAKLGTLSDSQFRVWFNLLCYSAGTRKRGIIQSPDLAVLAIETASANRGLLTETLDLLVALRIVSIQEDGSILFINFEERQLDHLSDSPEAVRQRVEKSRAKSKDDVTNVTNRFVTSDDATTQKSDVTNVTTHVRAGLAAAKHKQEKQQQPAARDSESECLPLSPAEISQLSSMADAWTLLEIRDAVSSVSSRPSFKPPMSWVKYLTARSGGNPSALDRARARLSGDSAGFQPAHSESGSVPFQPTPTVYFDPAEYDLDDEGSPRKPIKELMREHGRPNLKVKRI